MAVKTFKDLLIVERLALAWAVLTTLLIAAMWSRIADPAPMLWMRLLWCVATFAAATIGRRWPGLLSDLLRCTVQLGWLSAWYGETYKFNRWRVNLDWLFAEADWELFGCQPALEMSRWLDSPVWSELFNLGYFSYFPMIAVMLLGVAYAQVHNQAKPGSALSLDTAKETDVPRLAAWVLGAFFLYYIIYIALPVAGPQFYFAAIGTENAAAGIYPHIGTYFETHSEMLPAPGWSGGLFYNLVAMTQATGEFPTAAFPSSHIGVSTIVLMLAWRYARNVVVIIVPLWLLLCGATIYIQAHYLVDAIAGLLTAPVALWLSVRIYALSGGAREATRQPN